jgi:hypothetical protein
LHQAIHALSYGELLNDSIHHVQQDQVQAPSKLSCWENIVKRSFAAADIIRSTHSMQARKLQKLISSHVLASGVTKAVLSQLSGFGAAYAAGSLKRCHKCIVANDLKTSVMVRQGKFTYVSTSYNNFGLKRRRCGKGPGYDESV